MFKSPPNPIKKRANEISTIQTKKVSKERIVSGDDSGDPFEAG